MELRTMLACEHEGALIVSMAGGVERSLIIKGGFRAEVGSDY
jgi:hypothetical protein